MKQSCAGNRTLHNNASANAAVAEDVEQFKAAMRKLTSAVTIITTCHKDRPAGLTATAVTALSVSPPSLIACVNKAASVHDLLVEEGRFCVNILDALAVDIADMFSDNRRAAERFETIGWEYGMTGLPGIDGSVAHFECNLERALDGFSHTILIGVVINSASNDGVPLVYEAGRYGAFSTPPQ